MNDTPLQQSLKNALYWSSSRRADFGWLYNNRQQILDQVFRMPDPTRDELATRQQDARQLALELEQLTTKPWHYCALAQFCVTHDLNDLATSIFERKGWDENLLKQVLNNETPKLGFEACDRMPDGIFEHAMRLSPGPDVSEHMLDILLGSPADLFTRLATLVEDAVTDLTIEWWKVARLEHDEIVRALQAAEVRRRSLWRGTIEEKRDYSMAIEAIDRMVDALHGILRDC